MTKKEKVVKIKEPKNVKIKPIRKDLSTLPAVVSEKKLHDKSEEINEHLSLVKNSNELDVVKSILSHNRLDNLPISTDPLTQYVREISRYKLLSIEEEDALLNELHETGDIEVAKKLVLANLRLVVKIAIEYRSAWQNVMDLIQEGNIGLMKAVSKYDGTKGAKLSYYASWWIRSYILKFILDNFRLVKIGTTNEQKKLFFNLMKEKERLIGLGFNPDNKMISESLGVSEKAVAVMDRRLSAGGSELSLEAKLDENGPSLGEILVDPDELAIDDRLGELQGVEILRDQLHHFLDNLKDRDREIFEKRLLSEVPASLQSIADQYGVSRERIRQIEERLIGNLKVYMSEFIR